MLPYTVVGKPQIVVTNQHNLVVGAILCDKEGNSKPPEK